MIKGKDRKEGRAIKERKGREPNPIEGKEASPPIKTSLHRRRPQNQNRHLQDRRLPKRKEKMLPRKEGVGAGELQEQEKYFKSMRKRKRRIRKDFSRKPMRRLIESLRNYNIRAYVIRKKEGDVDV